MPSAYLAGFVSWTREEHRQVQSSGAEARGSVAESDMLFVVENASRLFFALGIKTLRPASAHPLSAKPYIHDVCTRYPRTSPSYVAFSNRCDLEGVFHTCFHTLTLVNPLGQLCR